MQENSVCGLSNSRRPDVSPTLATVGDTTFLKPIRALSRVVTNLGVTNWSAKHSYRKDVFRFQLYFRV